MAQKYEVRLLRKEKLAQETWLFSFEKPDNYIFVPGQYQTFTLTVSNGKSDWRDMTIASSPSSKELWMVTKIHDNSSLWKQALFNLTIGQTITLEGPNGGFSLRDKKRPYVFLAGGIGVTVFHSILKDLVESNHDIPITLLASFRKGEDVIFQEELEDIENENRKIIYTLTKEDWKGEKGRISNDMIRKYIKDVEEPIFMIAGGQEFVDAMTDLLAEMGVPLENIRIDYFTGY